MVASVVPVAWLSKALAFSGTGRCSWPHGAAFPATCAWVHLVLPNPIRATRFVAWSIGPAPGHDHCTERVLAWKVRSEVGITGKVIRYLKKSPRSKAGKTDLVGMPKRLPQARNCASHRRAV